MVYGFNQRLVPSRLPHGGRGAEHIRTLARKLDVVHKNTVASSSIMPIACLQRLRGLFPSLQTLTTLAGDRIGLPTSPSYLPCGSSSLFRGGSAGLSGGEDEGMALERTRFGVREGGGKTYCKRTEGLGGRAASGGK